MGTAYSRGWLPQRMEREGREAAKAGFVEDEKVSKADDRMN